MIEVEVPGGAIVEFPDGTPPDVIDGALRQKFGGGQASQQPNVAADMATGFGTGVARGAAGLVGLPGDFQRQFRRAGDAVGNWMFGEDPEREKRIAAAFGSALPTTDQIRQTATDVTGITLPEAQTAPGRYAQTVGEFAPAAVTGGRGLWELGRRGLPAVGTMLGDLAKFGVAPGIASEAAGQATEGSDWEPWARAGAAVAAGGVAALASRPSTPVAALREAAPTSRMTQADVSAARSLMDNAGQRGVSLTWPEALSQVTKGRVDITDIQRFVEQSSGGRAQMSDFMSRRPDQVRRAMDTELGTMGPQGNPVRTGIDIQRLSGDTLTKLRNKVNALTRPLYEAAGPVSVDPRRFQALAMDPLFQAALRDLRNDPVYARSIAGYPDMSVQVFDAVKKRLDDLASAASTGGRNHEASVFGGLARDVRTEAQAASPAYTQALDTQARYRQGVLEPAQTGPLGRMAETPDIRSQINAVFPSNPTAGSDRVVGQTIRRLVRQDPTTATQLVRTHLATAFDEAVQANVGGANQWGGAKAAATIIGNRQQERNLQAAIEALPAGNLRWRALRSLMEVFEATGKRKSAGSATDFNARVGSDMGRGGTVGRAAALAVSPQSALSFVSDFYTRFRLGKNTEALAQIITSPGSEKLFARLVGAKTLTDRQLAAALILYDAQQAYRQGERPLPQIEVTRPGG